MLEIRTFRSGRKGIRVDLFRKYKHSDEETNKPKVSYKQIGSFSLSEGYSPDLIELLQPEEVMQLQNWLSETRFAEQFGIEADALPKFTIRIPQPLYDVLIRLYIEGKRVGIDFVPNNVMLESLLHTAKLVQHKIDKLNGFRSGILEKIGIQSDKIINDDKQKELLDEESKILFKTLLDLGQPLGKICTELEEAARQYGKIKKIPPPQLREWAGDMPNRNPDKRIKKWCYAIAIDVLQKHGVNPITIAAPERVAQYWAIQRQETYSLKEAIEQFIKNFRVSDDKKSTVIDSITQVYKRLASV